MKKVLIVFGVLFLVITVVFISYSDIKITKDVKKVSFDESRFSQEYFSKNNLLLVNVWATWCKPCIAEFPELAKFDNQSNLKFISFSIDKDSLRLKKFLEKNSVIKNRDKTLENKGSLNDILRTIEMSGAVTDNQFINFEAMVVPYTVLIKNKKILYKANDEIDFIKLQKIISENQ